LTGRFCGRYSESRIEVPSCPNSFIGHLFNRSPIEGFGNDEKEGTLYLNYYINTPSLKWLRGKSLDMMQACSPLCSMLMEHAAGLSQVEHLQGKNTPIENTQVEKQS